MTMVFPKKNLLPIKRSHLDLRILTNLRGIHKDLMGKIQGVSLAMGIPQRFGGTDGSTFIASCILYEIAL